MNINEAIALLDQREFDASLCILNQLIDEDAQQVRAYYWRASVHLKMNALENALEDINQAIHIYDEYADAYSQRGVIYFHMGMLQLALKDMNTALSLEPENPYRYSSRAYILGHLKETHKAIDDYKTAIALDPEDAVAHNNLGLLEEQLGYFHQSKERLEKADALAVNKDGELIEQSQTSTNYPAQHTPLTESTPNRFISTLKIVLTSKEGLRAYWSFLKKLVRK